MVRAGESLKGHGDGDAPSLLGEAHRAGASPMAPGTIGGRNIHSGTCRPRAGYAIVSATTHRIAY
jgi:hypothetical protein